MAKTTTRNNGVWGTQLRPNHLRGTPLPQPARAAASEDGKIATPVPRAYCVAFCEGPILAEIRRCVSALGESALRCGCRGCGGPLCAGSRGSDSQSSKGQVQTSVEEVKPF